MNNKIVFKFFYIILSLIIGMCLLVGCTQQQKKVPEILLLPNLPYPIAKEPALITSAGQGPEGIIVSKMCDRLKIDNKYRYKADSEDLNNIACLIIVEGVSNEGLKASFTTLEEDKARIERLISKAKSKKTPIIAVFPGGNVRRTKVDDELINDIAPRADYVIALHSSDEDGFFSLLASKYFFRLTLMQSMQDILIPLNSVFR